jgi:hypothetical protein
LLELDLRDGNYWWPTRLYLLAALLSDYTRVERLVFVQGPSRRYVGMAEPKAIRLRIEVALPGLDLAYASARQQALQNAIQPPVPAMRPARLDVAQIIEQLVRAWSQQVQTFRPRRSWLSHTLDADLRWAAITISGGPGDAMLQYRLLTAQDDFIALVVDDRLTNVVSRCQLAIDVATAYLGAQLK